MSVNAPVRKLSRISFKSPLRSAARRIVTSPTFSTIKGIDFDKKNEFERFIKFIESSNKELLKIAIPTPEGLKEGINEETNEKSGSRLGDLIKTITGFNVLKWFTRLIKSWWNKSPLGKYINKMTRPWRARLKKIGLDFKKWRKNIGPSIKQGISNFLSKQKQRLKDGFKWLRNLKPPKKLQDLIGKIKNFKLSDITKHIKMPQFLKTALTKIRNAGGIVTNFAKNKGGAIVNWGKSKTGGLLRSANNLRKKIKIPNPFKNMKMPKVKGGLLTAIALIPDGIHVFKLFKEGKWKDASRFIIKTGVSFATFSLIFGASGAAAALQAVFSLGTLTPTAIATIIGGGILATGGSMAAEEMTDNLLKKLGLEDKPNDENANKIEGDVNNTEVLGDQTSIKNEIDGEKIAVVNKKEEKNKKITTNNKKTEKKNLVTTSQNKTINKNNNLIAGKNIFDSMKDTSSSTTSVFENISSASSDNNKILLVIPPANSNVVMKDGKPQFIPFPIGSGSGSGGIDIDIAKLNSKIWNDLMEVKLSVG